VRESLSYNLTQPPFHLIAHDRSTDAPAHREANPRGRVITFHESFGARIADEQKSSMGRAPTPSHTLKVATRPQAIGATPARSLRFSWWYTSGLVVLFHGCRAFTPRLDKQNASRVSRGKRRRGRDALKGDRG
jgi:hypothetical protein